MKDFTDDLKRYYEVWWENPKDPRNCIFKKLNKIVFQRLPEGSGKKALDIGAGKGTIVSYLEEKRYQITAVEINENFVKELRKNYPNVKVIKGDIKSININDKYDLVTAIEFVQNIDRFELKSFIRKISLFTDLLIINISNRNSIHGFWTAFRGFQKPFVHTYTPSEIEEVLRDAGFQISYRKGIGLLTPITLFSNFKYKIIPIWVTKVINIIGDSIFPKICHLYYIEAKKNNLKEN